MFYEIRLMSHEGLYFVEDDCSGGLRYLWGYGEVYIEKRFDKDVKGKLVFDHSAVKKALAEHPETPSQSRFNPTWAYAYWLSAVWLASCGAEWSNEAIASLRVRRNNDEARDLVQQCVTRFFSECSQDPEKIRRFVDGI